jgi:hypothetical protein
VTRRLTRSEGAWLAAIVVTSCVGLVLTLRHGFFYADDVTNLSLARSQGLTADLLTTDYFGHLAPGHRLLDWLVVRTDGSWAFAVALLLAFWALAVGAFYAVVRQLAGRGFLALASTAIFASSPVFVRTIEWPASGDHIVPATACTLAGLAASLHWHRTRAGWSLVTACVAAASGLLFYEKPILLLLYVLGILFFVRAPSLRPRALASALRADAPLLLGLLAIAVGYLVIIKSFDYAPTPGSVTLSQWEQYLRATWTRGTTPLLISQTVPVDTTRFNEDVVWIAQAVFAVLVVWSIARRLSAWRAWAFYGVAWAVNVGVVGYGRIGPFGVLIGLDPRYSAEIGFLLPLALVLAFLPSEPSGGPVGGVALLRRAEEAARGWLRRHPAVGYAALAPLVAVWVASCANSHTRLSDAWPSEGSRAVTERTLRGLDRVRATGAPATVLDGNVPFAVIAAGQGRIADWMHVFRPSFRFDGPAGPIYVIRPDGAVVPTHDVRVLYGRPVRGCLGPGQTLDIVPPRPFQGAQLLAQLRLFTAGSASVAAYLDNQNSGYPGLPQRTGRIAPGDPNVRLDLGAGPLFKLRLTAKHAPVCAHDVRVLAIR